MTNANTMNTDNHMPLEYCPAIGDDSASFRIDCDDTLIAWVDDENYARRLVACVNVLDGLDVSDIEHITARFPNDQKTRLRYLADTILAKLNQQ